MDRSNEKTCPRCLSVAIKDWPELTDEQKLLAERLPMSADYALEERKKHRFCTRCWFEEATPRLRTV